MAIKKIDQILNTHFTNAQRFCLNNLLILRANTYKINQKNMEKNILNILFNYKGSITYREFRAGIIILFSLIGVSFYAQMYYQNTSFDSFFVQSFLAHYILQLAPPISFMLSYCAIILTIKRMRMLNMNKFFTVASSILTYLFFSSLLTLVTFNDVYFEKITVKSILIIIIITLFVIGIINIIFLWVRRSNELLSHPKIHGKLTAIDYSMEIGILIVVSIIINTFIYILLSYSKGSQMSISFLYIIAIIFYITIFVLYIKACIYRLKDAGINVSWLIITYIVFLLILAIKLMIARSKISPFFEVFYLSATNIFIAAQYLLFLLPSKKT